MCYSPKQRPTLQQAFEKKSPIKIIGTRKHTKRLFSDKEEYTLSKSAKLQSTSLAFPYNDKFDKLHTCEEALEASIYQRIDLKVKVITKQPDKQAVVKNDKTYYKVECMVADRTNSIKLILWEDTIDKVSAGKSYLLQNVTVRSFDDTKFVNTNETTVIQEVDDIADANTNTPGLQENHLTGQCVGIDVKKNMSCLVCNHSLPDHLAKEETIVCPHCKVTTLSSLLNTKLVCHLLIKTDKVMHSYTCFNDALESYLRKINHPVPLADIAIDDLKLLLLKAGKQDMIADKTAKIIAQFL